MLNTDCWLEICPETWGVGKEAPRSVKRIRLIGIGAKKPNEPWSDGCDPKSGYFYTAPPPTPTGRRPGRRGQKRNFLAIAWHAFWEKKLYSPNSIADFLQMKILFHASFAFFMLLSGMSQAAVEVFDLATKGEADNDGVVGNLSFEITGGDILIFSVAFDAGEDNVLNGTVSATFGGDDLIPILSSFRSDGEVGSAIFYTLDTTPRTGDTEVVWGIDSGSSLNFKLQRRNQCTSKT